MLATNALVSRDLATFPLPPTLKSKLLSAGFKEARDFNGIRPLELAKELKCSNDEAVQILRTIKENSPSNLPPAVTEGKTAFEMITTEHKCISTLCEDIDQLLGDGVPSGQITEFSGVPGIGKTQMSMQLAVAVQIPEVFNGPEGECIYIDSEGSFVVDRVRDMAEAVIAWLQSMVAEDTNMEEGNGEGENKQKGKDKQKETEEEEEEEEEKEKEGEGEEGEEGDIRARRKAALEAFTVESILSRIHYYRVHDYVEQIALLNVLPNFIKEHPKVSLVVVDSVTFHFRGEFKDYMLRTRLLNAMAQALMSLAEHNNLAVVLVNQVTTKMGKMDGNSELAPALGHSWAHNCTNRIILFWRDGQRHAHLTKSPAMEARTVSYAVTRDGIRARSTT